MDSSMIDYDERKTYFMNFIELLMAEMIGMLLQLTHQAPKGVEPKAAAVVGVVVDDDMMMMMTIMMMTIMMVTMMMMTKTMMI